MMQPLHGGQERNRNLIEQSILAMGSNERQELEALRRSQRCMWGYGFSTHLKGVRYQAEFYARKLVWC